MGKGVVWEGEVTKLKKVAAFNPDKPQYMLVRKSGGGAVSNINKPEAEAIEEAKKTDKRSAEYMRASPEKRRTMWL